MRPYLLLSLLLTLPHWLPAQLNLFSGASFEHEVTPNWGYQFEVEHRQVVNTGDDNRVLLLGAINHRIVGRLDVTPGVRFTPRYDTDEPSTVRLFTDLNFSHPLGEGPFSLEARVRSQYERALADNGSGPEVAVRPRVGIAYQLLEHTGLVAEYEARYRFDTRDAWTQHRYTFGMEQQLSTRISVEAFFRLEREIDPPVPETEPTIGVFLVYVLPDRRDRDWRYRSPFGRSLLW
ncbi:hypothetical protein GGR26_001226 [Lewinella marina]|uniref:DUF2490 domain-containing protein n=1 Tax=Neolewinella marina TaxID=438751 RepID=A0A2G0CFT1_9BACT|nr:DUF2490 domain-containing protein [Neolewinella marina]NJB85481.1 hypothetical protein [Neolewinella marina]PHK98829.1 hypothetical protein CGL56_10225 [Neolewinella marina]